MLVGLDVNWEQNGELLVLLFVTPVAFETALTPAFRWRLFVRFCGGRGRKTPITRAHLTVVRGNLEPSK